MTHSQIVMTEARMKKAAMRLRTAVQARLDDGKPLTHAWMLESLSRGFFGKPYGEVRSTLLSPEQASPVAEPGAAAPSVLLLSYGSEIVVTYKGEYVSARCPGSDMEQSVDALEELCETLARIHDAEIGRVDLPELLSDDWEMDDVVCLARTLGYFHYARPLHAILESFPLVVFKSAAQRESLDGDGFDQVQMEVDSGTPWSNALREVAVWSPEFESGRDR